MIFAIVKCINLDIREDLELNLWLMSRKYFSKFGVPLLSFKPLLSQFLFLFPVSCCLRKLISQWCGTWVGVKYDREWNRCLMQPALTKSHAFVYTVLSGRIPFSSNSPNTLYFSNATSSTLDITSLLPTSECFKIGEHILIIIVFPQFSSWNRNSNAISLFERCKKYQCENRQGIQKEKSSQ